MSARPTYEELEKRVAALEQAEFDHQEALEALKESNNRFLHLAANVPAYFAYVNADTLVYEFVNDAFEKSFGIPREKIIGSHIKDVIGEANYQFALEFIDIVRSGKSVSYQNTFGLTSGKRWIQVNYTPVTDANGKVVSIVVLSYDISDRKQAEEALRESEEKYRLTFDFSPDSVNINRLEDGLFVDINQGFTKLTGFTREDVIGKTSKEIQIWHNPADRQSLVTTLKENGYCENLEAQFRKKDGSLTTALMSAGVISLQDEPHIISITRDISERLRAEEERKKLRDQLMQAQKMESVGRLAGGVAHDFNNMLMAIIGNTEMAMAETEPSTALHKKLHEIFSCAQRSADLTRQLLAFARRQTIRPKVLDLNELISRMITFLHRLIGEDVDLVWKPAMALWPVHMDPSQIDQILVNLAVNARDAIIGVGNLTIETENVFFDETYCMMHQDVIPGEYVLLAVSDTGCGVEKEAIGLLFEPFYTTKTVGKGTGLGLATVYGIVKQNDGFINVYSELGQGTTFKIYLPRTRIQVATESEEVRQNPARGAETVLLVEDEPPILKIGKAILERYGYTVLDAGTPAEAQAQAQQHQGPIHLLITDVVMPQMNGRDLLERIAASRPGIKTLYMSGYTSDVIAHHGVLGEGIHFLQKPFSVKTLAAKVREVLGDSAEKFRASDC